MKNLIGFIIVFLGCSIAYGADRLFYEGFESGTLNNVQKSTGVTINSNEHYSGQYSARVEYGPNQDGNQMIIKKLTTGITNEVYVKFWIKLHSPWQGDQGFKPFRANYNYTNPVLTVWARHACNGYISGQMNTGDGMFQRTINTNYKVTDSGVAPHYVANWTKIEVYIKKNSAVGVYDGIFRLWWNGAPIYNNSTMHPATATGKFFDTFYFPSNMSCDKWNFSDCCPGWDMDTPFYLYVDEIEIWNGMPDKVGTAAGTAPAPTGGTAGGTAPAPTGGTAAGTIPAPTGLKVK